MGHIDAQLSGQGTHPHTQLTPSKSPVSGVCCGAASAFVVGREGVVGVAPAVVQVVLLVPVATSTPTAVSATQATTHWLTPRSDAVAAEPWAGRAADGSSSPVCSAISDLSGSSEALAQTTQLGAHVEVLGKLQQIIRS